MSVVPEPTGGNSVVQIDNVPPKSNYVAPNAAGMAGASAKIKIGGAVFALILTAAGITGVVAVVLLADLQMQAYLLRSVK